METYEKEDSMSKYYAAVDMGASSGRLMVGWIENGKM